MGFTQRDWLVRVQTSENRNFFMYRYETINSGDFYGRAAGGNKNVKNIGHIRTNIYPKNKLIKILWHVWSGCLRVSVLLVLLRRTVPNLLKKTFLIISPGYCVINLIIFYYSKYYLLDRGHHELHKNVITPMIILRFLISYTNGI